MRVELSTSIYGIPPKLHLQGDLWYGDKEQYRKKIFNYAFSLDKGGKIELSPDFFVKIAEEYKEHGSLTLSEKFFNEKG